MGFDDLEIVFAIKETSMHVVRFAIYMLVSIAVYSAKQEPESGSVNRSVEESNPKIEVDHKGKETDGRIVRNRNREEQLKRELHARFKPSRLTYNKGLHFDVLQIRGKDLGQVNSQIDKGLEERITEYLSEINSPLGLKSSIEILQVYKINADVRKIRFRQTVNNIPLNDLSSIEIDSKGKVLNLNLWRIDEDELPPIMINEDQALQIAIDTVAKHFYADYITLGHKENKEDVNIQ